MAVRKLHNVNQRPIKYFRLERVFDHHLWLISSTRQTSFVLRAAFFKLTENTPMLREKSMPFWKISFQQLLHLDLSDSEICSIEGLSYCDMPNLQKLGLQDNNITQISALSKSELRNVKQIDISGNLLLDVSKLPRTGLPKLQRLMIDSQFYDRMSIKWSQDGLQIKIYYNQSIDFIVKMENNSRLIQFPIHFSDRVESKWYNSIMNKLNDQMRIYGITENRRRMARQNNNQNGIQPQIRFQRHNELMRWGEQGERRQRLQQLRNERNNARANFNLRQALKRFQNYPL